MLAPWTGRRVVVLGLGRFGGGLGAARSLGDAGADVLVVDRADRTALAPSIAALERTAAAGAAIELSVGHGGDEPAALLDGADLLVVNPAVPPGHPWLTRAADADLPVRTEVGLFLEHCRAVGAATAGITGTNGKSTTTALTEALLREREPLVGGNIGGSVLEQRDAVAAGRPVVLELSSFQLARLELETPTGLAPRVGCILNLAPHHLDWHGRKEAYFSAKTWLLRATARAAGGERAVVAPADLRLPDPGAGTVRVDRPSPADVGHAVDVLPVRGEHHRENLAAALAVARLTAALADDDPAWRDSADRPADPGHERARIADFEGLPHRLHECVRRSVGPGEVVCVDDSDATTPESAAAALQAFDDCDAVIWIGGGHDKGVRMGAAVNAAVHRAHAFAGTGPLGARLADELAAVGGLQDDGPVTCAPDLARAFELAWTEARRRAEAGRRVALVLSPGGSSYDEFPNYEARGRRFHELCAAAD